MSRNPWSRCHLFCLYQKTQWPIFIIPCSLYSIKHTFMLPRWLCHSAPRITPPGIFSSIKALRDVGSTKHTARPLPLPKAATTITRGRENTYLTYLGNRADPSASMGDYLHKAMPNASESLCFPLQRKNSAVEKSKRFFSKFNFMNTSHLSLLLAPHWSLLKGYWN